MEVMPLADAAADAPDAPADPAPNAAFSADAAAKYDAVMEFCLNRGQVLFTTLMTEFVNIHLGDLERYITSKPCCNVGQSYCICYSLHGQEGPLCCIYLSRLFHNIPCTKYSTLQQQNDLAAWQSQDKGCLQCAMAHQHTVSIFQLHIWPAASQNYRTCNWLQQHHAHVQPVCSACNQTSHSDFAPFLSYGRFLQKMVHEGLLEPTESKGAYKVSQECCLHGICAHLSANFHLQWLKVPVTP